MKWVRSGVSYELNGSIAIIYSEHNHEWWWRNKSTDVGLDWMWKPLVAKGKRSAQAEAATKYILEMGVRP